MINDQVILINPHTQRKLYAFLIVNALAFMVIYSLRQLGSETFSWLWSPVFYGLYTLFFIGTLLLNITNKSKKIIFSVRDQYVYSQTIIGKKKVMPFGDIGAIKPYDTSYGATYFGLFNKANLFGQNPIRISPAYSSGANDTRAYVAFERTVLPDLQSVIGHNVSQNRLNNLITAVSPLTFYDRTQGTYRLKNTYPRARMSYLYVAILLAISFSILATPGLRLRYINFSIGAGIGACIMAFLLTEKKSFQQGKFISEYTNGLFRKTYLLSQFSTFQITHRKHNFIYVGTDISLLINNQAIFLCQMRKTEAIGKLISETDFIIEQQS